MRRAPWFIVLLASAALAGTVVVTNRSGGTPPVSGFDLIDSESFDGTGAYDETGWTEYPSGSGATVDDDETATCPTADTGFENECLETALTSVSRKALLYNTLPSPETGPVYCRVYFNVTDEDATNFTDTESIVIAALSNSGTIPDSSDTPLKMYLKNNAGSYEIIGSCDGVAFGTTAIVIGDTHVLEMYVDQTSGVCDFKIDDVAKGPQSTTVQLSVANVLLGIGTTGTMIDIVWDNVACDTTGWVGGL